MQLAQKFLVLLYFNSKPRRSNLTFKQIRNVSPSVMKAIVPTKNKKSTTSEKPSKNNIDPESTISKESFDMKSIKKKKTAFPVIVNKENN